MEWFAQNWFSVITLIGIILGWAVHYGISTQRGAAMEKKVDEMETTLEEVKREVQLHCSNTDIHVSQTLLQLFSERSEFMKLQFSEMRNDIQRVEAAVTK